MKRFSFTLFILIFSVQALASYSYYTFSKKDLHLNKEVFARYIRPQAKNIVSEFYHILKKINPSHEGIILVKQNSFKLSKLWNDWSKSCPTTDEKCLTSLKEIYQSARKLDISFLKYQSEGLDFNSSMSDEYIDQRLITQAHLDKVQNNIYEILHSIEELLVTSHTDYEINSPSRKTLNKLISQLRISCNNLMTSLVSKDLKVHFERVWVDYIRPLEEQIVIKRNQNYLVTHLEQMNIVWNSFHMNVSKGGAPFPKKHLKLVDIMHNRWNWILKSLLRKR